MSEKQSLENYLSSLPLEDAPLVLLMEVPYDLLPSEDQEKLLLELRERRQSPQTSRARTRGQSDRLKGKPRQTKANVAAAAANDILNSILLP